MATARSQQLATTARLAKPNRFARATRASACAITLLFVAATASARPTAPPSMLDAIATQVAAGNAHTCALLANGTVQCWGFNNAGQLGDGQTADSDVPMPVLTTGGDPLDAVVAIAVGLHHGCALTSAGGVRCWGGNTYGQLGDGTYGAFAGRDVAADVVDSAGQPIGGVVAIAAGAASSCALTTSGEVECWGYNGDGELGNNNPSIAWSDTPVTVDDDTGTPLAGVVAIAAGGFHACALTSKGQVQCWGYNTSLQLGNTNGSESYVATDVLAGSGSPLTGIAAITAGHHFTCALTDAGGVQCWGGSQDGELGSSATSDTAVPLDVVDDAGQAIRNVVAISAGGSHACALISSTAAECWGANNDGQLGNGGTANSDHATPVVDATNHTVFDLASISVGGDHTCARDVWGALQCWGSNVSGQLGDSSTSDSHVPAVVTGFSAGVALVTASWHHTCALTSIGEAKCWGNNVYGMLGDGSGINQYMPVDVAGLGRGVLGISSQFESGCAVTATGNVQCWGWNGHGQLGDGTGSTRHTPVPVLNADTSSLANITAVAAAAFHTCALTTKGGIQCWGDNSRGELGDGSVTASTSPVDVVDAYHRRLTDFTQVITSSYFSCGLTTLGVAQCWGANDSGELGDGTTADTSTPKPVANQQAVVLQIAAGGDHACALGGDGSVRCWGNNGWGQLGSDPGVVASSSTALPVAGLPLASVAIAAGQYATCAVEIDGSVYCWGRDGYGHLGTGAAHSTSTPAAVNGLAGQVVQVAMGTFHTCAVTAVGTLQCWGWNKYGELGDGSTTSQPAAVTIASGQTIAFDPPAAMSPTQSVDLTLLASARGGPISFDTWTPSACSVSGTVVTALTSGALCGIRASQLGGTQATGGSDAAAPQQLRIIRIRDVIFANGFDGP